MFTNPKQQRVFLLFISFLAVVALALLLTPVDSWAVEKTIDSRGILSSFMDKFREAASKWETTILDYARRLFWGIAIISPSA